MAEVIPFLLFEPDHTNVSDHLKETDLSKELDHFDQRFFAEEYDLPSPDEAVGISNGELYVDNHLPVEEIDLAKRQLSESTSIHTTSAGDAEYLGLIFIVDLRNVQELNPNISVLLEGIRDGLTDYVFPEGRNDTPSNRILFTPLLLIDESTTKRRSRSKKLVREFQEEFSEKIRGESGFQTNSIFLFSSEAAAGSRSGEDYPKNASNRANMNTTLFVQSVLSLFSHCERQSVRELLNQYFLNRKDGIELRQLSSVREEINWRDIQNAIPLIRMKQAFSPLVSDSNERDTEENKSFSGTVQLLRQEHSAPGLTDEPIPQVPEFSFSLLRNGGDKNTLAFTEPPDENIEQVEAAVHTFRERLSNSVDHIIGRLDEVRKKKISHFQSSFNESVKTVNENFEKLVYGKRRDSLQEAGFSDVWHQVQTLLERTRDAQDQKSESRDTLFFMLPHDIAQTLNKNRSAGLEEVMNIDEIGEEGFDSSGSMMLLSVVGLFLVFAGLALSDLLGMLNISGPIVSVSGVLFLGSVIYFWFQYMAWKNRVDRRLKNVLKMDRELRNKIEENVLEFDEYLSQSIRTEALENFEHILDQYRKNIETSIEVVDEITHTSGPAGRRSEVENGDGDSGEEWEKYLNQLSETRSDSPLLLSREMTHRFWKENPYGFFERIARSESFENMEGIKEISAARECFQKTVWSCIEDVFRRCESGSENGQRFALLIPENQLFTDEWKSFQVESRENGEMKFEKIKESYNYIFPQDISDAIIEWRMNIREIN